MSSLSHNLDYWKLFPKLMVSVFYPWQLNSIIDFPCLEQLPFTTLSFLPFHNKSKSFQSASMIQHYLPLLISPFFPCFSTLLMFVLKYHPRASSPCLNSRSCCFLLLHSLLDFQPLPQLIPFWKSSEHLFSFRSKLFLVFLLSIYFTGSFLPCACSTFAQRSRDGICWVTEEHHVAAVNISITANVKIKTHVNNSSRATNENSCFFYCDATFF